MAKTSIPTIVGQLMIGSADQKTIAPLFAALVADLETLRAAHQALCTKLDSNHGAATDHVATVGVAAGALSVTK